VRGFEGLHRRAAFFRYTQVTDLAREALNNAYRMHGIQGQPDDINAFLDLQAKVELFEIRNLSVGKEAPDIEGEDQDGKRFKLSELQALSSFHIMFKVFSWILPGFVLSIPSVRLQAKEFVDGPRR